MIRNIFIKFIVIDMILCFCLVRICLCGWLFVDIIDYFSCILIVVVRKMVVSFSSLCGRSRFSRKLFFFVWNISLVISLMLVVLLKSISGIGSFSIIDIVMYVVVI